MLWVSFVIEVIWRTLKDSKAPISRWIRKGAEIAQKFISSLSGLNAANEQPHNLSEPVFIHAFAKWQSNMQMQWHSCVWLIPKSSKGSGSFTELRYVHWSAQGHLINNMDVHTKDFL